MSDWAFRWVGGQDRVAQGIYRDRRPPVARFVRRGAGPWREVLVLTGHPPPVPKGRLWDQ